jgi:putative DNA primase/helicase
MSAARTEWNAWIDEAKSRDILAVAQMFGAKLARTGANEHAGPCPMCGGRDRFSVNTKKKLWNCRGCGKGGDVIQLLRHILGATFNEAIVELTGEQWTPIKSPQRSLIEPIPDEDASHRHQKARWLWAQRRPLAGSTAETYLRQARGYGGPLPATIGFLSAFKDHPPSLIAAFAMPNELEPGVLAEQPNVQSVQLTALAADGSGKADVEIKKRTIGPHKGLPIVVSPPNDGLGLSIHEGVEDALSAYEATNLGCWASGGAPFLPDLADAVPSYIETVTIVGHQDKAGGLGARELALRLVERGINVLLGDGGDG